MSQRTDLPKSLVLLASGRGSNAEAVLRAVAEGTISAEVRGIVSDRRSAKALELGPRYALPTRVVRPRDYPDRETWDEALGEVLTDLDADLVVLAGFMRILGNGVLRGRERRIINVHPSLLPAFPGAHGPEAALAAGVRISGCTVHLVDAGVDTGPILAQAAVPVLPGDTASTLHKRIQSTEHRLLPAVLGWITRGELSLANASLGGTSHTDASQTDASHPDALQNDASAIPSGSPNAEGGQVLFSPSPSPEGP
ncbi:MAG: phosphoribosylglycinamide formyltransferase [Myxococcota bacterium]